MIEYDGLRETAGRRGQRGEELPLGDVGGESPRFSARVDDEYPGASQTRAPAFEPQAPDPRAKRPQAASPRAHPSPGRIGADREVDLARVEARLDPPRDEGPEQPGLNLVGGGDDAYIEDAHGNHLELRIG